MNEEELYAEMCQAIGETVMKLNRTGEVISKETLIEWLAHERVSCMRKHDSEFYEVAIKFLVDG